MEETLLIEAKNIVGWRGGLVFLSVLSQSFWLCPQHSCHFSRYPRYVKKTFLDILWNGFWINSHFMWVLITTFYFCCCAWWWWWWSEDIARKYSNGIGNVRELEERGCLVLHKVDAKQMSQHYFLKTQRFDRIVYNLPHVGFLYRESSYCQIQLCYVSLIFLFYSPLSLFYFILFFFYILFP